MKQLALSCAFYCTVLLALAQDGTTDPDGIRYQFSPKFMQLMDSVVAAHSAVSDNLPVCLLHYTDGVYQCLFMFVSRGTDALYALSKQTNRFVGNVPVIFQSDIDLSNTTHHLVSDSLIRSSRSMTYGGFYIEYKGYFYHGSVLKTGWVY
jgi:hypothetical protein